jgi:hypothetical protein
VLTIIENESNTWMIVTVGDGLRVYSRAEEGEWSEMPLGEDPEQVDQEKSFMLEELYARESEDEEGEIEGEEDEEEESDEGEPELAEDQESGEDEDEDDEEEEEEAPKPRRRRAAASKTADQK